MLTVLPSKFKQLRLSAVTDEPAQRADNVLHHGKHAATKVDAQCNKLATKLS